MSNESISTSRSTARTFFWLALISIVASIATHGYLLSHHYALKFGDVAGQSLCNISSNFNCEAVAASRFSEILHVPVALWGALANGVLLVFALTFPLADNENRAALRRNILVVAAFIAFASLVMGGISLFVLGKGCPFCILAYVLSFVTLGTLIKALPTETVSAVTAPRLTPRSFMPLAIAAAIAFAASFVINDQVKKSYGFADMSAFIQDAVQQWETASAKQIQTLEPLAKGPEAANATMTIVEFADFRCIHCAHAAPIIEAFVSSHPDVRLEFQAWPLDGECNSSINVANGASCLLARTVYCASKVGSEKGWAAHKYVFEHRDDYPSVDAVRAKISEIAKAIGVETSNIEACTQAPETKSAIEKQAAVGTALNLSGTPSFFVNGKKLSGGQSLPVLQEVYRHVVK